MKLRDYIKIEKKPQRKLMPLEWTVLTYVLLTLLMVLFTYTKLDNPNAMVWGRVRLCFITLAAWGIYELLPCRLTRMLRVLVQGVLLVVWYPDTYELNRILPNLDHHFALLEQELFGCQPALLFCQNFPQPWVSELMDLGYASYYPMIALTLIFFFLYRYRDFERCAWIIFASFFAYYIIYDLLPVTGPTFYYKAIGMKNVVKGVFPSVGDYFNTHQDCLPSPGYTDGIFYQLVEAAKAAGERPTAAFPSSHVGVSTICMLLVAWSGNRKLLIVLAPLYILLCMATVYIQAHYAIDAIAGLVSGTIFFFIGRAITLRYRIFATQ
ncbi:MAG: phosphatase PAP2 family protein [Prevotella sp.]|jgi:membrane-associated phospholipid phosphatase